MTNFQIYAPPDTIKQYVAYFYLLERKVKNLADQTAEFLLPSGYEIMGIHLKGRWEASFADKKEIRKIKLPEFYVTGQQTVAYDLTQTAKETAILGFALRPKTIFNLFKFNPSAFNNLVYPIKEISVISTAELRSILPKDRIPNSLNEFAEKIFSKLLYNVTYNKSLTDDALEFIYQKKGCLSVDELCLKIKINKRTLQRFFLKEVGISPIKFIRIIRFNNLITELEKTKSCSLDYKFLSSYYSFYDASHFNKEFKKFCGSTPGTFMAQQHDMLWKLLQKNYSIPSLK